MQIVLNNPEFCARVCSRYLFCSANPRRSRVLFAPAFFCFIWYASAGHVLVFLYLLFDKNYVINTYLVVNAFATVLYRFDNLHISFPSRVYAVADGGCP